MFANAPFHWTDSASWPWIINVWLALLAGLALEFVAPAPAPTSRWLADCGWSRRID
jgi:hypothetical protein